MEPSRIEWESFHKKCKTFHRDFGGHTWCISFHLSLLQKKLEWKSLPCLLWWEPSAELPWLWVRLPALLRLDSLSVFFLEKEPEKTLQCWFLSLRIVEIWRYQDRRSLYSEPFEDSWWWRASYHILHSKDLDRSRWESPKSSFHSLCIQNIWKIQNRRAIHGQTFCDTPCWCSLRRLFLFLSMAIHTWHNFRSLLAFQVSSIDSVAVVSILQVFFRSLSFFSRFLLGSKRFSAWFSRFPGLRWDEMEFGTNLFDFFFVVHLFLVWIFGCDTGKRDSFWFRTKSVKILRDVSSKQ